MFVFFLQRDTLSSLCTARREAAVRMERGMRLGQDTPHHPARANQRDQIRQLLGSAAARKLLARLLPVMM